MALALSFICWSVGSNIPSDINSSFAISLVLASGSAISVGCSLLLSSIVFISFFISCNRILLDSSSGLAIDCFSISKSINLSLSFPCT